MAITILDGPLGTALNARGIPTPAPGWSAQAIVDHPEVIRAIHRSYAEAGATLHTANTFRTTRRAMGQAWAELTQRAVDLARDAVPSSHRVAGSIAPLEDCYEPWRSPAAPRPEHRDLAQALAAAGCDLLLCETFPHVEEALIAVEEAVATGVETWAAFTAGPTSDLLSPAQVLEGAARALHLGATTVLVNCTPASTTGEFVDALARLGAPFGAYANAGHPTEGLGWRPAPDGPERYAAYAQRWVDAGATIIGACCGTDDATVRALASRFGVPS